VCLLRPVAVLTATTRTRGIGAPLESRTVPEMVPVGSAARAAIGRKGKQRKTQTRICRLIKNLLSVNLYNSKSYDRRGRHRLEPGTRAKLNVVYIRSLSRANWIRGKVG